MEHLHPVFALALAPFATPSERQAGTFAPSVVDVLVEDVRYRARRHAFVVTDLEYAARLAGESATTLALKASPEEIREAALRFMKLIPAP